MNFTGVHVKGLLIVCLEVWNVLSVGVHVHVGTRPDTRLPVVDVWAGAALRVFVLFNLSVTD